MTLMFRFLDAILSHVRSMDPKNYFAKKFFIIFFQTSSLLDPMMESGFFFKYVDCFKEILLKASQFLWHTQKCHGPAMNTCIEICGLNFYHFNKGAPQSQLCNGKGGQLKMLTLEIPYIIKYYDSLDSALLS